MTGRAAVNMLCLGVPVMDFNEFCVRYKTEIMDGSLFY